MTLIHEGEKLIRVLTAAGLLAGGAACTSRPEKPAGVSSPTAAVRSIEKPPTDLQRMRQEMERLVSNYPSNSLIRNVYTGDLRKLSPVFDPLIHLGLTSNFPDSVTFLPVRYTINPRFRYLLFTNQTVANYATVEQIAATILFPHSWIATQNDEVKRLTLEREAVKVSLLGGFSRIAYNNSLMQGKFQRIDPSVSDDEIAWTMGIQLLRENSEVLKLFQHAGDLAILPQVGELLGRGDANITKDLDSTSLPRLYREAIKAGIPFQGLVPGSKDYLAMAFDPESPWTEVVLGRTIRGTTNFN